MALNDKTVYYTESIDVDGLTSNEEVNDCIKLSFSQGTIVYIGLGDLETGDKKDTSFIQHLALSMLPPFLPSVVDIEAIWKPEGWPSEENLPDDANEGVAKILDAWQGLVMNEGVVAQAVRRSVLDAVEDGLIVNSNYYN